MKHQHRNDGSNKLTTHVRPCSGAVSPEAIEADDTRVRFRTDKEFAAARQFQTGVEMSAALAEAKARFK